jgi:AraC-like DNA-binding protein/quercetin dioxygenase-like cupin family protein
MSQNSQSPGEAAEPAAGADAQPGSVREGADVVPPDGLPPASAQTHAAGETIGNHRHAYHQLLYVSQGILSVHTQQGTWIASRHRALWTPAGLWHQHLAHGRTRVHTIGFAAGSAPLRSGSPTVVAVDGLLHELLTACTDDELPAAETGRLRAVVADRLRRAHVQPLALPSAQDPRLAEACRLVTDDLSRPRTMTWLARRVGAGERTLARLFRGEFGMTYPQWRTNVRVFHAMLRLSEGASVTRTAQQCGWATTSAFIDTFTRTMGQTPGTYRSGAVVRP